MPPNAYFNLHPEKEKEKEKQGDLPAHSQVQRSSQ